MLLVKYLFESDYFFLECKNFYFKFKMVCLLGTHGRVIDIQAIAKPHEADDPWSHAQGKSRLYENSIFANYTKNI